MDKVTPIRETIQHHLGNAAQIAELWAARDGRYTVAERKAFGAIRDHLKQVLDQLGEPNLEAIQAAEILLREYENRFPATSEISHTSQLRDEARERRDICAAILHAQVTGNVPPTWSEP